MKEICEILEGVSLKNYNTYRIDTKTKYLALPSSVEELKGLLEYLNKGYNVILEIDIEGALKVKEIMKDVLCIFILPPSMKELRNRLYKRNRESEDKILARFKKAYQEINEIKKYNYVVVNDEVINAVNKIEAILLAEKCRVDRIEELDLDTLEESVHEDLIKRDK